MTPCPVAVRAVRGRGGALVEGVRDPGPARWLVAGPASAVAGLCVHGLVETNLHVPANALLCAVVLGLAYAAAGRLAKHSAALCQEPVREGTGDS